MTVNTVTKENADEVARTVKGGTVVGPATVRRSLSIKALAQAMLDAQQEMEAPARTTDNPYYQSKYADLAEVRDAVLPSLWKHGLMMMQLPCEMDGSPALQTLLIHPASGEWVETTICLHVAKDNPQGVGSAITYARRYALQAVTGVAAEDDDGNEASRPAIPEPARQAQNPPQPPPLSPQEIQAQVADWKDWLDRQPDLAAFNETLGADLGALPRGVKKPVWDLVCSHASGRGWVMDKALKRFVESKEKKAS